MGVCFGGGLTLWWGAGAGHHEAGQRDGAGCSALQRDGEEAEVTEHVHDGGEAQVLHPALTPFSQGEAQVLQQRNQEIFTGNSPEQEVQHENTICFLDTEYFSASCGVSLDTRSRCSGVPLPFPGSWTWARNPPFASHSAGPETRRAPRPRSSGPGGLPWRARWARETRGRKTGSDRSSAGPALGGWSWWDLGEERQKRLVTSCSFSSMFRVSHEGPGRPKLFEVVPPHPTTHFDFLTPSSSDWLEQSCPLAWGGAPDLCCLTWERRQHL